MIKPPKYWYNKDIKLPIYIYLLYPLKILLDLIGIIRNKFIKGKSVSVPVICVGNISVGGTGKTPAVITLAKKLSAKGYNVSFISRGYPKKIVIPINVDLQKHTSNDVGDEGMLLAKIASTWVSSNRFRAAQQAKEHGANIIIMDDGFQNPTIHKDFSIITIDSKTSFGNGYTIPLGPLREMPNRALSRAQAVIIIGDQNNELIQNIKSINNRIPVFSASIKLKKDITKDYKRVIAFTGIGLPQKFFLMLEKNKLNIIEKHEFPDHHFYTEKEIQQLIARGKEINAKLVTTEKDFIKIPKKFHDNIHEICIELQFNQEEQLFDIINHCLN